MRSAAKAYKCPVCGYVLQTGPYDWLLELEEAGEVLCPRCRRAKLVADYY
ncbi:MAG: hypothetical protein QXT74_04295 [Candidatus Nezhaarchaeales archaeon]